MDIENIAKILEEFSRDFTIGDIDREYFSDFVIYNDVGLPLAQSVVYDLATPTEEGRSLIIETWNNLCEILGADPEEEYSDLDDVFGLGDYDE